MVQMFSRLSTLSTVQKVLLLRSSGKLHAEKVVKVDFILAGRLDFLY